MKTKILTLIILLALISNALFAQLQITDYGSIGLGIDPGTRTDYKQFIKGDLLLTTYPDIPAPLSRYTELRFKVGNGSPGCEFGTPTRKIAIWSSEVGYNDIDVGNIHHPSDRRLKANIASIENGLTIIRQLHPYSYNRSDTLGGVPSALKEYGFIAQDVAQFLPEITDSAKGILLLDYDQLIPFTVSAVSQLDSITNGLSGKIDSIKVTADNGLTANSNNNIDLGGNLTKATQIGLNNQNLTFADPTNITGNNNIAIGSVLPYTKFSVNNGTNSCAGNFATTLNSSGYDWGIQASATGGHPNEGGNFSASGGDYNYGVIANATGGSYLNYGVEAFASGGSFNTAGYFNGDLVYTGNFYKASDSMLKQNITPVTNAMSLISQLNPKTFTFKTSQYPYLNLPTGTSYGLIAQDVATILPNLVTTNVHPEQVDQNGNIISPELAYKSLNYDEFVPIIIQGMKEMKSKNDSLNNVIAGYSSRFDSLEAMINKCCSQNQNSKATSPSGGQSGNNATQSNVQYIELDMANAIILNQNDPNPFAEETDITYFLPETVGSATIMFYDNTGVIIKAVQLQSKGNGTLHVFASNLSSGMYTYALIVDGKLIDSKKMMKTK